MGPERISHFDVLDRLGAGGMGVVYRARDCILDREVALKLIRPELTEDDTARARFLRECRTEAALTHPGIAVLYEAGETDDGQLFFAAELVEGETLSETMSRGPLDFGTAVEYGYQLADALAAAHRAGIVHRDIKPANIMVGADGRLKVLDFGLARLLDPAPSGADQSNDPTVAGLTRAGTVVGTPAYMAPEQITGSGIDARADVFACGAVMYEMLTGARAFPGRSSPSVVRAVLSADPEPPHEVRTGLPPELGSIVSKAMEKEPDDRYDSAAELAEILLSFRSGSMPAMVPARSPKRLGGGRRLAMGLIAVVALIAAVAFAWFATRPALTFENRDRLLVAGVDNRTGEEAFDLALRTALEADIAQSPFASVFDQSRVADTLRLMRRDPGTAVDEELGREVCRFAGVRALLLPRVLSVGDAYELHAVLVDPISGRHVESIRVVSSGKEEVLVSGIDELTREVRSKLGESIASIEKADAPVAQVTTSSWEALQAMSLGQMRWSESKLPEAMALFERALEFDPAFAVARGSLGLIQIQFMDMPEQGIAHLRQALADSDGLPERERMMIKAVNLQFVDQDLDAAMEQYRLISDVYPDLMQPFNNRGRILLGLGRAAESIPMFERAAELEPTNGVPLVNIYWVQINRLSDPAAGLEAADRLLALSPDTPSFHQFRGWALVAAQRFPEARDSFRRAVALEPHHPWAFPNLAHTLLRAGDHDEALDAYRRLHDAIEQGTVPGDLSLAVLHVGVALEAAGRTTDAIDVVGEELRRFRSDDTDPRSEIDRLLHEARLLAFLGRPIEARDRLGEAHDIGIVSPYHRIRVAETLAMSGDPDGAIEAVELALESVDDRYFPLIVPTLRSVWRDPRFEGLFEAAPESF